MTASPRLVSLTSAAAALVLLVAACLPGAGDLGTVAPPTGSSEPSIDIPSPEPTPASSQPTGSPAASPGETTTVRVYFMLGSFTGNSGLVPVLRTVPKTQAVGRAAIEQLLAGPVDAELAGRPAMYTGIPDGVRFLGLDIEGGGAVVDLSSEFDAGGSSATLAQRYAQVVYTLTQFPTVDRVRFLVNGNPTPAVVTGGAIDAQSPITRGMYQDLLPAIWVDRPAWGGALPSGTQVSGLANVFEAQFRMMVLDAGGRALSDRPVMATCGSGCLGTFDVQVAYRVSEAQWGTLRVFEPSAKDGSPTHVVDYPVWLTP